jgi:hypothetical protein
MENYIQNEGVIVDTPTNVISDNSLFKSTQNSPVVSFTNLIEGVSLETKNLILKHLSKTPLKNTYVFNGKLYQICIYEKQDLDISFKSIFNHLGKGKNKKYNPDAEYQRRGKQHSESSRQEILLALLSGENVGLLILKKNIDGTYDIVDGKQRMEIVKDFISGSLTIPPKKAANFWKLYLDKIINTHIHDKEDKLKCSKIVSKLSQGKYPKVNYLDLPTFIKESIFENDELKLSAKVADIQVTELGTNKIIQSVEEAYNEQKVGKAIFKKFIDINKNKAVIKAADILWAAGEDSILENRRFLETLPNMGSLFGYVLKNKPNSNELDDTDEVRNFMILLARASMLYQGDLKWGDSTKKYVTMVLDEGKGDFNPVVQDTFERVISVFENGLFSTSIGPDEKTIQIPSEFTSSRSDILKLSYFLMMWYVVEYIKGKSDRFISGGEPKMRLLRLVEKLSIYLTLGKLGNIDHTRWNDEKEIDLPLIKYKLKEEFYSEEYFEGIKIKDLMVKIKDLNIHQSGLSGADYDKTFRTLIKYVDSKLD